MCYLIAVLISLPSLAGLRVSAAEIAGCKYRSIHAYPSATGRSALRRKQPRRVTAPGRKPPSPQTRRLSRASATKLISAGAAQILSGCRVVMAWIAMIAGHRQVIFSGCSLAALARPRAGRVPVARPEPTGCFPRRSARRSGCPGAGPLASSTAAPTSPVGRWH